MPIAPLSNTPIDGRKKNLTIVRNICEWILRANSNLIRNMRTG